MELKNLSSYQNEGESMANLSKFLKRHQLIAYFILTYILMWVLLIIFQPLYLKGQTLVAPLFSVGIFAPALVSIGLSSILKPQPKQGIRKSALISFFVIWILASPIIILHLIVNQGMNFSTRLVIVAVITGMLPAFVCSCVFSRRPGPRDLLRTCIKPRGSVWYYLLALILVPAIWILGNLLSRLLGTELPFIRSSNVDIKFGEMVILFFLYNIIYGGISEEPGWRGFALPRLQAMFNPLVSSLILGVIWAVWHAPAHFGGIQAQSVSDTLVQWILIVLVNIIFTWLFNRTKGSILVTAFIHAAMNTTGIFLTGSLGALLLLFLFIIFIIVFDKIWQKLPKDHPALYRESQHEDVCSKFT